MNDTPLIKANPDNHRTLLPRQNYAELLSEGRLLQCNKYARPTMAAKLEARREAANIAKLPKLLRKP